MKRNTIFRITNKFRMILMVGLLIVSVVSCQRATPSKRIFISENKRFFALENGDPFFWLGDTGWLLFSRLTREESETYLNDRKEKGFNVIQVMLIHEIKATNVYGDSALRNKNVA